MGGSALLRIPSNTNVNKWRTAGVSCHEGKLLRAQKTPKGEKLGPMRRIATRRHTHTYTHAHTHTRTHMHTHTHINTHTLGHRPQVLFLSRLEGVLVELASSYEIYLSYFWRNKKYEKIASNVLH